MVAELCPWKELQPRAFSLMPLVFSIGSIIGPIIGGTMANPLNKPAGDRSDGSLLWKYPYALPNLVAAVVFLISIAIGFLFLQETLDIGRRDYGIIMGQHIIKCVKRVKTMVFNKHKYAPLPSGPEPKVATKGSIDEENADFDDQPIKLAPPSWKEALTNQTILMLVSYTFLAMHNTAFDQVISVFMHSNRVGPEIVKDQLPLRFNKGFGLGKYLVIVKGVFSDQA
jgi:MFS family permease